MLTRTLPPLALAGFLGAVQTAAADEVLLGHELYGSGPEKVFVLHDWMGDHTNYDALRPWLDAEANTYAFADVRGYGLSKALGGAYTSDEIAADVMRLADHLGWERFHLVGHSMNGLAGFRTILRDWQGARRIKSFTAITPVTPDGYPASAEDEAFLTAAITDDATAETAFAALTGQKNGAVWSRVKTRRHRASSRPEALKGYFEMWLKEDFSVELAAAGVGTPVQVIGGRNDLPGFQEEYYARTIANWLPAARFFYITDAGHYPMQETPVLLASRIDAQIAANR